MKIDPAALIMLLWEWPALSAALFSVSGKLKWRRKWAAFVPGYRFLALGDSLAMNAEGTVLGILDALFITALAVRPFFNPGSPGTLASEINLILFIFYYIYRIRVFLKLLEIFGLRKLWAIFWLIANWIPILIIGLRAKYQPIRDPAAEESWQAGTDPAAIPAAEAAPAKFIPAQEGLSVELRERAVREHRKKRILLKDISLNIPNGSLVLLLGGSGSGKTTFVNAVIGYEKADATVLLNGTDVYRDYARVIHKIGFVPQKNLIRGKDAVANTVDDAAKMRLPASVTKDERKQITADVMDTLGLSKGMKGLVEKKSGGQLRRICIAMEFASDPELLVLDEPDSGLDGGIARETFGKLRRIADEGRIVMVITHTPDRVIDLFDKVIVLARDSGRVGRLAFYGSPSEARAFFGKETMEGIVMRINSLDEGGEGLADEYIGKYAACEITKEGGAAK